MSLFVGCCRLAHQLACSWEPAGRRTVGVCHGSPLRASDATAVTRREVTHS